MPDLLDPITVGDLHLPNRVLMAPLTRNRAAPGRVPNAMMVEYYRQRASAGLIISEASSIDPSGECYPHTPGIWSSDQVEGWRKVTRAVHSAGGRIFLQLWHAGRIAHPIYLEGQLPVAPSAIAAKGHVHLSRPKQPCITPRALTLEEMPSIVDAFRKGAQNAQRAGFDGVEIHGANGYLLDQFLQDNANRRDDAYGGSIQNRARLMLEVVDAIVSVWGAGRVGMQLAPRCNVGDMSDSDPAATFSYVARELGRRRIAFICPREQLGENRLGPRLKEEFGGIFVANEGFTKKTGQEMLAKGEADAVAYGKLFISNPDLPRRFALDAPLTPWMDETFYSQGSEGYTDYPSLEPAAE
ncbi:NADH:flavin oxidoreductase [Bradyrhizobium pachyrhizi]|uniref:alkene reductase n=1 Tax=Bradyrhizobium pachyrhizi TaxID=280333 RepID=UPI000704D51C|nr:alkene reductase [Bradyrhizobium pachyrhizi]KRP91014.1 NADH:flavin oxidoreductase [Bradyrhizobium pachyrhizi]